MAPEIRTERRDRAPVIFGTVFAVLIVGAVIALLTFMIIDLSGPDERMERAKIENQAQIENCWKMGGKAIIGPKGWLKQCEVEAP